MLLRFYFAEMEELGIKVESIALELRRLQARTYEDKEVCIFRSSATAGLKILSPKFLL